MAPKTFDDAVAASRLALGSMGNGDPGSDDLVALDLRVATVFRREDDGWYLCLRHADRVTTPRS